MTKYDAILIGAGHNALACAAHLAKRGWKVGLFEAADLPGGAVKTLELTEPGFRHDLAAMNLSLFAGSAFNRTYGAELTRLGLEFAPVQDCFASVFPDGRWLGVSTDPAATTARIRAFSTRDAETWEGLIKAFPARAERLFSILGAPMKKRALARILFTLLRRDGLSGTLDLGASCCPPHEPGWTRLSRVPRSRRCWAPGACIWILLPISPAAPSSPTSKAWPTRTSAWCWARAERTPSSRRSPPWSRRMAAPSNATPASSNWWSKAAAPSAWSWLTGAASRPAAPSSQPFRRAPWPGCCHKGPAMPVSIAKCVNSGMHPAR